MRPAIQNPLFRSTTKLSGVGPQIATKIERIAGTKVIDILWHLPREIIDRNIIPNLSAAETGKIATLSLNIVSHEISHNKRQPYRVYCTDGEEVVTLVFFHARTEYLKQTLPTGHAKIVSGKIERFRGNIQITHPDYILSPQEFNELPIFEPVYTLTEGLTLKTFGKIVRSALKQLPNLPEWHDTNILNHRGWPNWYDAIRSVHNPIADVELSPKTSARERLAYDELLSNQLAIQISRKKFQNRPGRSIKGDDHLIKKVMTKLPFKFTTSQRVALKEITDDMATPSIMVRLLQGDVGSGKTIVALFAILKAIECGGQAALMAPTEILARQHMDTIETLVSSTNINTEILTSREKGATREKILTRLGKGEIDLIIGTHALFQSTVKIPDLMLAVVDEQHRFGVHQRLNLAAKGKGVDMLLMTATPIPRTLLLTSYGDLETSQLREKPKGRKPVDTRTIPINRLIEVVDALERRLNDGAKAYWICPLIEDSETTDLVAVKERYDYLRQRFGNNTELVHGKMKNDEKDKAMLRFSKGQTKLLVATTVIEVGIDVSDATIMVIEQAERFGLAQLHQLRGRIGRNTDQSVCILLYDQSMGKIAHSRLKILRGTEDGFRIAEEDLRLRGGGEILGTRQSGLPEFRLADLTRHNHLLSIARDEARLILNQDPDLTSKRGYALRNLLYLFQRDEGITNLRSG